MRIIFRARKYQSIQNERLKKELFFFGEKAPFMWTSELAVSKVLRCESLIQILNALIKENEVHKFSEVRSTAKKNYQ